ncbi:MAG: ATP-binding cassette domain-containing protein, partial [Gammaproteobacteria bacterium]|nr:ATP-binding cassette domain-containing protein [Gammaproteobacteria bacterium]
MSETLCEVKNLRTWFDTSSGRINVVDDVSFSIKKGETFVLLGESGCGKSMTALSLMRLLPMQAAHNIAGRVLIDGEDLLALPEAAMRNVRGNKIAMIFQEPMTSLNPVLTVGNQISEVLSRHKGLTGAAARARVIELLEAVGIPDPAQRIDEYPHQLSGGMKQRVMIAMALAGEPDLLIADEPTTALDVTIQAQVLDLIRDLQKRTGMAVLMITHDLGVVYKMADHVAVMYAGQVVETASRDDFFSNPLHPYSQKLFEALPTMEKRDQPLAMIPGTVPPLNQVFNSCRFAPRCGKAWDSCEQQVPQWINIERDRGARCHLLDKSLSQSQPTHAVEKPIAEKGKKTEAEGKTLLEVKNLKVHFPIHKGVLKRVAGYVYAVDDVSVSIKTGKTLALVGESGCGKTTLGKGVLQLVRPTAGQVQI